MSNKFVNKVKKTLFKWDMVAKKANKSKQVSERLKILREMMGWSQSELARQFGVSPASANRWETGEHDMSGTALKLLEIYERKAAKFRED